MRLVVILPVITKKLNSISSVFINLKNNHNYNILILTSTSQGLKGKGKNSEYEDMDGVAIHRIFEDIEEIKLAYKQKLSKAIKIVENFKPDIMLTGTRWTLNFAYEVANKFSIPLILLLEFAQNSVRLCRKREYLGLEFLAPISAKFVWKYLTKMTSTIITSFIGDQANLGKLSVNSCKVFYVPWCNQLPEEYHLGTIDNKKNQCIFAGELSKITITKEFMKSIPLLLNKTKIEKLVVIGYGPREIYIRKLISEFPSNIEYLGPLPRLEVLKHIEESKIAFQPARSGGWGFIGECWALGTPLFTFGNHYGFKHKIDSIILNKPEDIIKYTNDLLENNELYSTISNNGKRRYIDNHTGKSVADRFAYIIDDTLTNSNQSNI